MPLIILAVVFVVVDVNRTLAQFLSQQEKPLEEEEILSIFSQIVLAIKYMHQYNVLHRFGLKPSWLLSDPIISASGTSIVHLH